MCGIAGIVGLADERDLSVPLARMHRALAHRGPDDEGLWLAPSGAAAFAHRRLSIIDPSPAGHQPMQIADGRWTITYNGEIYNFAELRRGLSASGVTFRSQSDTEVILRLYEADGPAMVERLRGMFAFAIWDERERTCFLARDRFGIKPLFYADDGRQLLFASELRAVMASGLVAATPDINATYDYFRTGSVLEPATLIAKVRMLEAGHHQLWRDGHAQQARYWQLAFAAETRAPDAPAITRAALVDSVRHHFVSDVPVGVFLSGGLDSTALLALARTTQGGELRTFSLTFPGMPQDEGALARRTAAHFGTVHHEWELDADSTRGLLGDFLAASDQPSIDGLNTFTVSRLARAHQTTVVLSGLGGDELFGGYPSFARVPRLAQWARAATLVRPLARAVVAGAATVGSARIGRLGDLVDGPPDLANAYGVFRGIYNRYEAAALTRHYTGMTPNLDARAGALPVDPTPGDTVSRLELTRYMRNQLLRESDVMSMASGVEVRTPFIDAGVVDTVSAIPAAQRLRPGKGLLRAAVPEIPMWILEQPKRGFLFPMEQWHDAEWADAFTALERDSPVRAGTWYRKWSLMAFTHWHRTVGHDAPPSARQGRTG